MQNSAHFHRHEHPAADGHSRRAELEDAVIAHRAEGLRPPGYATAGLAMLEALLGADEDPVE